MAANAGSSNTSSTSTPSSRRKRRRLVQKLMEADAKEVSLNKRVAESMTVRRRKIENKILSTSSWNPGTLPLLETSSESSGQSSPSRASSNLPVFSNDRAGTRQLKKYCGVAFPEENTVDVVPKNWLVQKTGKNYLCVWPPTDNKKELQRLTKEAVQPEDGWVTHECELIHSSKSYAQADAAVKHYQSEKDLDMFSTDTEFSQHSTSPIYHPTTAPSKEVLDVNCSNCSRLENRIISLEQEVQSLKKILLEVKVISQATFVSVQKLNDQNTPQGYTDFTQLKTVQELKAFNKKLSENDVFSKMIFFFSAIRGKDAHATTRRIMSVLMSNDLAQQYNWIGGSLKNSFQEFKLIIQLVAASVRHIKDYAETPVTTIESWVARWLRYANDRQTSGKKRKQVNVY